MSGLTSEYGKFAALLDSFGSGILSSMRYAAKFAVYEQTRIRAKNHHTVPTIRPDIDLKINLVSNRIHWNRNQKMYYSVSRFSKFLNFYDLNRCFLNEY